MRRRERRRTSPLYNELKGGEAQFLVDYHDYYRTPRGFHPRAVNSGNSWTITTPLSFMNMPILTYIKEISPRPILFIHGEKAHSRYFSETAYAAAAEPKELMIIQGANHVDLYDRVDVIPFDAIAALLRQEPEGPGMTDTSTYLAHAWAARRARAPLAPLDIPRRAPTPRDVRIEILYCGICHSDLHYTHDDWHDALPAVYPAVPGHEIVGRVSAVGASVTKHAVGDLVAVGCLVDSDHTCPNCRAGRENFCPNQTLTFGSPDRHGTAPMTFGGYSSSIVVDEHFVLRVPTNLDPAGAAPLLCAGITTYSPLKRNGVGPGKKVGIVGLGGLGHMGVKLARAFGAHVVVLTTSPRKAADALRLGAHEVILSTDADAMKAHAGSFDFILDTVSAEHDINADPRAAEARRQPDAGRRTAQAVVVVVVRADLRQPQRVGIEHRRHRADAGDARLLRCASHHRRRRGDRRCSRSTRPGSASRRATSSTAS